MTANPTIHAQAQEGLKGLKTLAEQFGYVGAQQVLDYISELERAADQPQWCSDMAVLTKGEEYLVYTHLNHVDGNPVPWGHMVSEWMGDKWECEVDSGLKVFKFMPLPQAPNENEV